MLSTTPMKTKFAKVESIIFPIKTNFSLCVYPRVYTPLEFQHHGKSFRNIASERWGFQFVPAFGYPGGLRFSQRVGNFGLRKSSTRCGFPNCQRVGKSAFRFKS